MTTENLYSPEQESVRRRDPARTKNMILHAALAEFSEKGFEGARVDMIAEQSHANKRMIYHYYGNKNGLYIAVLEHVYREIRSAEQKLQMDQLPADEAINTLIEFLFDYFVKNPHFIKIINNENLRSAEQLKQSEHAAKLASPLIEKIRKTLNNGALSGMFRNDVDAEQLYISITGLAYFYLSNAHTLSIVFQRNLLDGLAIDERLNHIKALISGYLRQT